MTAGSPIDHNAMRSDYQFSLKSLLVVVTLFSMACGVVLWTTKAGVFDVLSDRHGNGALTMLFICALPFALARLANAIAPPAR